MAIPTWIKETIADRAEADGDIVDVQVLKDSTMNKLAVVSTTDGAFVVQTGLFQGKKAFDVEIFPGLDAGSKTVVPQVGSTQASAPPAAQPESTVETPAPEIVQDAGGASPGPFGDVHPIVQVEGIGPTYEQRLVDVGIEDTRALVQADTAKVAEAAQVSEKVAGRWQSMASLISLNGIGPQYAELLARSGVGSIQELAGFEPDSLLSLIEAKQDEIDVNIQGNTIGLNRTRSWIEAARSEVDEVPETPLVAGTENEPNVGLTIVQGIGQTRADQLAGLGIGTLADLRDADTAVVAEELDVGQDQVAGWQNQVDLTVVKGIGPKRAASLNEAGILTVRQLAQADAAKLAVTLDQPEATVARWQESALESGVDVTDLLELKGIGPARAIQLFDVGITSQADLSAVNPSKLVEALSVSEAQVADWQAGRKNGN